jgi:hypothetical protein
LTILFSSILATCPNHSTLFTFNFCNYVWLSIHISQFLIIPNFPLISSLPLLHIYSLKFSFPRY